MREARHQAALVVQLVAVLDRSEQHARDAAPSEEPDSFTEFDQFDGRVWPPRNPS